LDSVFTVISEPSELLPQSGSRLGGGGLVLTSPQPRKGGERQEIDSLPRIIDGRPGTRSQPDSYTLIKSKQGLKLLCPEMTIKIAGFLTFLARQSQLSIIRGVLGVKYQAEYNIKGQIGGEQSLKRFLTHSPPT
jgi:hypothetical protein